MSSMGLISLLGSAHPGLKTRKLELGGTESLKFESSYGDFALLVSYA